jgi:transcriptional regulator with XRE-family HTH domain
MMTGMILPDPALYDPDPKYLRTLVERTGLSQRQCAARIGVGERTMRGWLLGERQFPYTAQFAIEQLANAGPLNRSEKKAGRS